MFHENAEADVVGEDGLSLRAVDRVVSYRRVKLGDQESRLRLVLVAHDVSVGPASRGWRGVGRIAT